MSKTFANLQKSNYLVVLLFLFLSTFFFYGLDKYAIFSIDDWPYSWVSEEKGDNYFSPFGDDAVRKHVDSVEDAIVSQSREYFRSNGRFITHVMVQTICGTVPMSTFVIINTMVFFVFLFCMIHFSLRRPYRLEEMMILLGGIWFLIPFKGMTFFGNVAMTVNYLWTTTFTLLFMMLYYGLKRSGRRVSFWGLIGLFILSVIVGSLQESFCIGFAGAFFFLLILGWKTKTLTRLDIVVAVGYMIGAAFCVLSPANFSRAHGDGIGFHFNVIYGLLASPAFDVFLITLVFYLFRRRNQFAHFVKENFIFSLAFLFNLLFALVIAYNGRHQLTCISVLALILTCKIWFEEFQWSAKWKTLFAVLLTVGIIITYIPIKSLRKEYNTAYEELIDKVKNSNDSIIGAKKFADLTGEIHNMPLVDNYYVSTFSFFGSDSWERGVSLMLTDGQDLFRLRHVLPENPDVIAAGCIKENEVLPELWRVGDLYVCRSDQELPLDAFRLKVVKKPKAFFMSNIEEILKPSEKYFYNGCWYYLFMGGILDVKSFEKSV